METLRKEVLKINGPKGTEEFLLEEKDFGDLVVFDVSHKGKNLMTLGRDGAIVFLNFDVPEEDKRFFKLSYLNQFVEKMVG
jgi:hypothetical protein